MSELHYLVTPPRCPFSADKYMFIRADEMISFYRNMLLFLFIFLKLLTHSVFVWTSSILWKHHCRPFCRRHKFACLKPQANWQIAPLRRNVTSQIKPMQISMCSKQQMYRPQVDLKDYCERRKSGLFFFFIYTRILIFFKLHVGNIKDKT